VTYNASGSLATEARLSDLTFKKQINYGDLSISNIGWPIDIPLVNTREIQISAMQANGQPVGNNNLIVYGRFIKHDKNVNET
jgi:hypothetical protein